eukprot:symbB.v1.2.014162.t1/scaffold1029.1/size143119/4
MFRWPELGALVTSALIAGSMFLLTNIVKDAFPPLSLVMLRLLVGCGGLLLAYLGAKVVGLEKVQISMEETLILCVIGWMNTVLPYSLYAAALGKGESVSAASALAGATPIFTALIGHATPAFRQWPGAATSWAAEGRGLLLGISGVLLIVFRRGSWSHGSFQGLGLQFMGVLCKAAAACLTQAKNSRKHLRASPLLQALVQAASGAALAVVLSLSLDGTGATPQWLDPLDLVHGQGGVLYDKA